jgi:hypothetical protein
VWLADRAARRWPAPVAPPSTPRAAARHTFSAVIGSDKATWDALVGNVTIGKVSRATALAVPSVCRARDLICSTLATLPLHATNAAGERIDHAVLDQPESLHGRVRACTLARTAEDLMMEAESLWVVAQRDFAGFPVAVEHIDYPQWTRESDGTIRHDGREIPPADCILFTALGHGLLTTGAGAVRMLRKLDAIALLYAAPMALEWFASETGADPDDAEILTFLADWQAARDARATAWVPSGIARHEGQLPDAEKAALTAQREHAVLEVARLTGVDAEELSVSTTSRTYSNTVDRRRQFVDFTLGPFRAAIEQRLSLGDFTPRGQQVRFSLDAFLRSDLGERYTSYTAALAGGWLTLEEIRELENRPPLSTLDGTP